MENKNNVLTIGLVALVLGLFIGYLVGKSYVVSPVPHMMTTDMHGAMDGMMSGLTDKSGDTLDKAFLDGMIVHHEGALRMAETLLQGTKRPELLKLGKDIISAQTQEIQMMKDWNKKWFNQ